MSRRKRIAIVLAALIAAALVYGFWPEGPNPADDLAGAYRGAGGELVMVTVREHASVRVMSPRNGWAHAMTVDGSTLSGSDGFGSWSGQTLTGSFVRDESGTVSSLSWTHQDTGERRITRVPLREREIEFKSGDLTLHGLLVLPESGDGPFPIAVGAHGSGSDPAVRHYRLPYLAATHGMAGFVFDKRGTGRSEGKYSQNFPDLAGDVVAAAHMLRELPEVDPTKVSVVGYSQGGWISTLAASMDPELQSIVSNYGVALPVFEEDRWGYVWSLQHYGYGEDEIAEVNEANQFVSRIIDDRDPAAYEDMATALEELEGKPYTDALRESDSTIGFMLSSSLPLWVWKLVDTTVGFETFYGKIDRRWDPRPVIRELKIPSYWLFAGDDSSAPTPWSVAALEKIRTEHPDSLIEVEVLPGVEHGMLTVEGTGSERKLTGYSPGFDLKYIEWLQKLNEASEAETEPEAEAEAE